MSAPCEKLPVFADGELAPPERPAFHRHLARCAACQQALESALMLDALALSFAAPGRDAAQAAAAPATRPLPLR